MGRRIVAIAVLLAGGFAIGLTPSEPERTFQTQVLGPGDRRPGLISFEGSKKTCFSVSQADGFGFSGAAKTPIEAAGDPGPGSTLKIAWRDAEGVEFGVVELDRFGRSVAFFHVVKGDGGFFADRSERLISCSTLVVSPECKAWPGLFFAEAKRRADLATSGAADKPEESWHFWARKFDKEGGFADAGGVWHAPPNCAQPLAETRTSPSG